ncbi:MAG TPA: thiolase family protein [Bacillota bacterium]
MVDTYVVDAVRTPFGRRRGSLSQTRADELAAANLRGLVTRSGIDPAQVEDVILGCVTPLGEQGFNVARVALLIAGFPVEVPGVQVNRMCGSSQQAVHFGAQAIMAGQMDLVIAGGIEAMSRVGMGSDGGDFSQRLTDKYLMVPQGISAEMIADKWNLSREDLDRFSLESHRKAAAAQDAGRLDRETMPVETTFEGRPVTVAKDEGIRRETSMEKMAALQPSFKTDGKVTAANASQISDGAAMVLLASEKKAAELGLTPIARIVATAVVGVDPTIMLTGPLTATPKVLKKAGLKLQDIDLFEVNEAFASVPLAWLAETKADPARLNVNGGAIALGHPLGASGARLIMTTAYELERRRARYGLVTMCIGLGLGTATIIERVSWGGFPDGG